MFALALFGRDPVHYSTTQTQQQIILSSGDILPYQQVVFTALLPNKQQPQQPCCAMQSNTSAELLPWVSADVCKQVWHYLKGTNIQT